MKARIIYTAALCGLLLSGCNDKKEMKAGYSGEDLRGKAEIVRDQCSKAAQFDAGDIGEWKLYAGSGEDGMDFTNPVAIGEGAGGYELNIPAGVWRLFQLEVAEGRAALAERRLPMEGGYNFRDLGGYRTTAGRYVKWGKLFRTDELGNLTGADLDYLASIPVVSVVDFRSQEEIELLPDLLPSSLKDHRLLSITPGNLMAGMRQGDTGADHLAAMMQQLNVSLVSDSASVACYREFFAMLQDENKVPLIFHCSAGKDRTGMAAALVLSALGVDRETIMEDYILSNHYLGNKYEPIVKENPALKPMFEVQPEYIKAGLDKIDEEYGSMENYLRDVLNVDIDKLRGMYLYPAE